MAGDGVCSAVRPRIWLTLLLTAARLIFLALRLITIKYWASEKLSLFHLIFNMMPSPLPAPAGNRPPLVVTTWSADKSRLHSAVAFDYKAQGEEAGYCKKNNSSATPCKKMFPYTCTVKILVHHVRALIKLEDVIKVSSVCRQFKKYLRGWEK